MPYEPIRAQRYHGALELERMRHGKCPECGLPPETHGTDPRFWIPTRNDCTLRQDGVADRIAYQRELDRAADEAGGPR